MPADTVVVVLAGGRGERLLPLTKHRAKPAVPFGGKYRIVDFVLSNCIHSGLNTIIVVPQYKYDSLLRHLDLGWDIFNPERGEYLRTVPPQMRVSEEWYQGTADAVYQNLYSLRTADPRYVLLLSADQVYRLDYREVLRFHVDKGAELTIAGVQVGKETARGLGVMAIDDEQRVVAFEEKPATPATLPGQPDQSLVSMAVYAFGSRTLVEQLEEDMADSSSSHDFGKDIVPKMVRNGRRVYAYMFRDSTTGQAGYWRDIGTIESYHETNMQLLDPEPVFDLYSSDWRTIQRQLPSAKIVFKAQIRASIIGEGCIIDEGTVSRSILSPRVRVGPNTQITDSIVMEGVEVQEGVRVVRAIIDEENVIPAGSSIEAGKMNYRGSAEVTASGIVVIPRFIPQWHGR
jgi:glucose-1-phosphate adenylyltransferase